MPTPLELADHLDAVMRSSDFAAASHGFLFRYGREIVLRLRRLEALEDSHNRVRSRPAGDYPEFMLQIFLDDAIAGPTVSKQAGQLLRHLRARLTECEAALEAYEEQIKIIVANARIQPDVSMEMDTDIYAVPLDDIQAARSLIARREYPTPEPSSCKT